eukprot:scaffold139_cov325-Pavlova_lutheri.AAC.33
MFNQACRFLAISQWSSLHSSPPSELDTFRSTSILQDRVHAANFTLVVQSALFNAHKYIVCSVPRALQNPLFECFGMAPLFPRADVALGSWSAFEDLSMDLFNSFHGPPSWCLGSGIPWWKDRCKVFGPCCCRTRVSSPTLPVPGGPSDPGMS